MLIKIKIPNGNNVFIKSENIISVTPPLLIQNMDDARGFGFAFEVTIKIKKTKDQIWHFDSRKDAEDFVFHIKNALNEAKKEFKKININALLKDI